MAKPVASCFCLILLAVIAAISCAANAARLLDELNPAPSSASTLAPTTALPSGPIPAAPVDDDDDSDEAADPPLPDTEVTPPAVTSPISDEAPPATTPPPVAEEEAPIPSPTALSTAPAAATTATTATATAAATAPALSFFMHDILGGSHPSARVVAGLIARTDINGIPFSTPNNNIFPLQGGTPLLNPNNINNLINPNTAPLMTGLNPGSARSQQTNTVLQNAGSSVVNPASGSQPFVTAGQLPAGLTLQKLMFGSITVFDDELTEGHELGSAVLGKAQGFYLASSLDGTSHTLSLSLLLHGGEKEHEAVEDTISFFGIHRNASPVSHIAVVGGTGKYEDAKGYATIETIQQEDQHVTDGVDTITHINVYLSE